jgi:hypothetical protein
MVWGLIIDILRFGSWWDLKLMTGFGKMSTYSDGGRKVFPDCEDPGSGCTFLFSEGMTRDLEARHCWMLGTRSMIEHQECQHGVYNVFFILSVSQLFIKSLGGLFTCKHVSYVPGYLDFWPTSRRACPSALDSIDLFLQKLNHQECLIQHQAIAKLELQIRRVI